MAKGAGASVGKRLRDCTPIAIPLIPIIIAAIALLSLLTFTLILPSTNKGKADNTTLGSTDTGKATLNNLTVSTKDSNNNDIPSPNKSTRIKEVTIDNTTMTEQQPGSGVNDYAKILNNNTVLYNISYTVTTPGTITLVFTLPANNYIDSSSVSSAAGCLDGSKLQKADTVANSNNGNNTTGNTTTKSYINNQAICIINATATGTKQWQIKANPWGGNNETITPTIAIGNQQTTPTIQPTKNKTNTVMLMGKPKYAIENKSGPGFGIVNGVNRDVDIAWGLYVPMSDTGIIGVEPLSNFSITLDTSKMPTEMAVRSCKNNAYNGKFQFATDVVSPQDDVSCSIDGVNIYGAQSNYCCNVLSNKIYSWRFGC